MRLNDNGSTGGRLKSNPTGAVFESESKRKLGDGVFVVEEAPAAALVGFCGNTDGGVGVEAGGVGGVFERFCGGGVGEDK